MKNAIKNLLVLTVLCLTAQICGVLTKDEEALSEAIKDAGYGGTNIINLKKIIESKKIDVNHQAGYFNEPYLESPLHLAVRYSNIPAIKYLIKNGADIDAFDADNETALEKKAVDYSYEPLPEDLDTIKTLLFNNAKFDVNNASYREALRDQTLDTDYDFFAMSKSYQEAFHNQKFKSIFDEIINYKNNTSKDALIKAINHNGKNDSAFTKYEWLTLALLNNNNKQILHAIEQNVFKPFSVLVLIESRPDISLDIVNSLLSQISDKDRETLMKLAKKNNNKKFGKKLLEYGIKVKKLSGNKLPQEIVENIVSFE